MTSNDAYEHLISSGVKPSLQRMAIMRYLMTHCTHPTVEEVYCGLSKDIPTLSRTTVYNTLRLLSEHGAAQMITIDEHRVCYDGDTSPHSHFYCEKCKQIYDLHIPVAPQANGFVEGHKVCSTQIYYRGVCSECLKKEGKRQG